MRGTRWHTIARGRALRTALAGAIAFAFASTAHAIEHRSGPPETPPSRPSFDAWREFGSREGLMQSTAYALAQDRAGYVWAGTEDGVARYDGRRWHRVALAGDESAAPPYVYGLAATTDGAVWVAGARARAVGRAGRPRPVGRHGLRVRAVVPRHADRVRRGAGRHAIGGGGAAAVDGLRWAHREVIDLRVSGGPGAQTLWIATRGGIARARLTGTPACLQLRPPRLPSATVYQLRLDGRGRLYLFGYEGVLRPTPDPTAPDDLSRIAIERFDENDGLPALEFNRATYVDDDGRLWAGTIAGVVVRARTPHALSHAAARARCRAGRVDARRERLVHAPAAGRLHLPRVGPRCAGLGVG
jgi:ligand-binding sensor domain-containing protein